MEFAKEGKGFIGKYKLALDFVGIKIPASVILMITIVAAAAVAAVGVLFIDMIFGMLGALLVLDIGLGIPFYLAEKKVETIERRLPDVLHHIAVTLKTAGTVETALREVAKINYGPITDGIKQMIREISEGKSFEDAFRDYAFRSRSMMLQKSAVIIIAARKSGGSLYETLTAMAEDIRELSNLKRERRSKTFMQFAFILVAGCLIAPFVFGILKSVLGILVGVGGTSLEGAATVAYFDLLFKGYLFVEASLSTLGAVQVREGKWTKGVIYIPITVIAAYLIYVVASSTFISFLGAG